MLYIFFSMNNLCKEAYFFPIYCEVKHCEQMIRFIDMPFSSVETVKALLRHWDLYCTFVWSWEFLTNAVYWQRVWITTPVFTGTIEYVTSCVFAFSAANLPAFIRAKPVWITTWKQTRIKHQQQKQQLKTTPTRTAVTPQ